MPRRTATLKVALGPANRDNGKVYVLTEMSAAAAERWGMRMFLALKGSGTEVSEASQRLGMVGVAFAGINAFLRAPVDFADLEPLLDEMMACVKIVRDEHYPDLATDLASPDDVEDVQTRLWLRSEVLKLHTDFSAADVLWSWMSANKATDSTNT